MINPIYKFEMQVSGGAELHRVYPLYGDGLRKEYRKETNEEFFRASLSGDLTFIGPDYDFILNADFAAKFIIVIYISHDAGATWAEYWRGSFVWTDCEFNTDDRAVKVTPQVVDQYTEILDKIEQEFDIIKLLPDMLKLNIDRRPLLQIYRPGTRVIGCYMGGQWWEQECAPVEIGETITVGGDTYPKLSYYYHFGTSYNVLQGTATGTVTPSEVIGDFTLDWVDAFATAFTAHHNGFDLVFYNRRIAEGGEEGDIYYEPYLEVRETGQESHLWQCLIVERVNVQMMAGQLIGNSYTMLPTPGAASSGELTITFDSVLVLSRLLLDAETYRGLDTYPLPYDDITGENKGYKRVIAFVDRDMILTTGLKTNAPTEWGIYDEGLYYAQPPVSIYGPSFPVSRSLWGMSSMWFLPPSYGFDSYGVASLPLNNTYFLSSVISRLLGKIAPGINYVPDIAHSQFFYGTPGVQFRYRLGITPKSNLLTQGYDTPAMKGPITLRQIFDMLRDCFRCYWFIENNQLKIEHILYFRNGRSYITGAPLDINLRELRVPQTGKPWTTGQNTYTFDKPQIPVRYQFKWMDPATEFFNGYPIEIKSPLVDQSRIEDIAISNVSTDVDYMLINPGACSRDGFALFALTGTGSGGETPVMPTDLLYHLVPEQTFFVLQGNVPREVNTLQTFNTPQVAGFEIEAQGAGEVDMELLSTDETSLGVVPIAGNHAIVVGWFTLPPRTAKLRFLASIETNVFITCIKAGTGEPAQGGWYLPYYEFRKDDRDIKLLNGPLSFQYLQRYYAYDMPARSYSIDSQDFIAEGVKRYKTQKVKFPALEDPDTLKLIGTGVGNGEIRELSINLSSREAEATLNYDIQ